MKANEILRQAADVIEERGKLRDKQDGERSMARAVEAYFALRGEEIVGELDGWLFMCCLKLARATAGKPHLDDWTDLAGYAALGAEYVSSLADLKTAERIDEWRAKKEAETGNERVSFLDVLSSAYGSYTVDPDDPDTYLFGNLRWHAHTGSGIPDWLDSDALVQVVTRGFGQLGVWPADSLKSWWWADRSPYKCDIVAYRVITKEGE